MVAAELAGDEKQMGLSALFICSYPHVKTWQSLNITIKIVALRLLTG